MINLFFLSKEKPESYFFLFNITKWINFFLLPRKVVYSRHAYQSFNQAYVHLKGESLTSPFWTKKVWIYVTNHARKEKHCSLHAPVSSMHTFSYKKVSDDRIERLFSTTNINDKSKSYLSNIFLLGFFCAFSTTFWFLPFLFFVCGSVASSVFALSVIYSIYPDEKVKKKSGSIDVSTQSIFLVCVWASVCVHNILMVFSHISSPFSTTFSALFSQSISSI